MILCFHFNLTGHDYIKISMCIIDPTAIKQASAQTNYGEKAAKETRENVVWLLYIAGLQLTVNWETTQRQLLTVREP